MTFARAADGRIAGHIADRIEIDCKKNGIDDPMEYYCNKINHYHHALYISGTNLPYGHSKYTHLSYQAINTLNFTEEQFANVVKKHCDFIKDPKTFLRGWNEPEYEDDEEERKEQYYLPNWQRAIMENPLFEQDIFDEISLETCVEKRISVGGTSVQSVEKQIEFVRASL